MLLEHITATLMEFGAGIFPRVLPTEKGRDSREIV